MVGSSTLTLLTCLRMSATAFNVDASKHSSSAASLFIASLDLHGTAKMVMPFVHPEWVLSPLEEKLRFLTVKTRWGVTYMFDLCSDRGIGLSSCRSIHPNASVVAPSVSISNYIGGVVKDLASPWPVQAWKISHFDVVILESLSPALVAIA